MAHLIIKITFNALG